MTATNTTMKLNWNATGAERVNQNASNLLQIGYYENAFDRTMGNRAIDIPATSTNTVAAEVYRNFMEFMPEVTVRDVRVTPGSDGNTLLEVDISDG